MQLELKLFAKQKKINLYWFLKTLPHTHTPLKIKIKKNQINYLWAFPSRTSGHQNS